MISVILATDKEDEADVADEADEDEEDEAYEEDEEDEENEEGGVQRRALDRRRSNFCISLPRRGGPLGMGPGLADLYWKQRRCHAHTFWR